MITYMFIILEQHRGCQKLRTYNVKNMTSLNSLSKRKIGV